MAEPVIKKARMTVRDILTELIERTNSMMRRMRGIEQTMDVLNSRSNSLEQAQLEKTKELKALIDALGKKLTEESERIIKIETNSKKIVGELKRTVSASKMKELEQLVDIYNPLKSNFITKEEAGRLIEEKLVKK